MTELFGEVTRSESSNEVGETSKKVGLLRRGIEIETQGEVEELGTWNLYSQIAGLTLGDIK